MFTCTFSVSETDLEDSPSTEKLMGDLEETGMLMEVRAYMADGLPKRHLPSFLRRNKLIQKEFVSPVRDTKQI